MMRIFTKGFSVEGSLVEQAELDANALFVVGKAGRQGRQGGGVANGAHGHGIVEAVAGRFLHADVVNIPPATNGQTDDAHLVGTVDGRLRPFRPDALAHDAEVASKTAEAGSLAVTESDADALS